MADSNSFSDFLGSGMPVIGPALNAVAGYFGQKSSNNRNLQQVMMANQANRELAEYQAQYNERMWHMQNEYNSPSAQMERYASAGLNPNLVYGQGNNGNASNYPTYDRPTMQAGQVSPYTGWNLGLTDVIQNALAFKNAKLDLERKQIENDKATSEKAILDYQVIGAELANRLHQAQGDFTQRQLDLFNDTYQIQKNRAQEEFNYLLQRKGALVEQRQYSKDNNSIAWRKMDLMEQKYLMQLALDEAKYNLTNKQIDKLQQDIDRGDIAKSLEELDQQFFDDLGGKGTANYVMKILIALIRLTR